MREAFLTFRKRKLLLVLSRNLWYLNAKLDRQAKRIAGS